MNMFLPDRTGEQIELIIYSHKAPDARPIRSALFYGPRWCGKTTAAAYIAERLGRVAAWSADGVTVIKGEGEDKTLRIYESEGDPCGLYDIRVHFPKPNSEIVRAYVTSIMGDKLEGEVPVLALIGLSFLEIRKALEVATIRAHMHNRKVTADDIAFVTGKDWKKRGG